MPKRRILLYALFAAGIVMVGVGLIVLLLQS